MKNTYGIFHSSIFFFFFFPCSKNPSNILSSDRGRTRYQTDNNRYYTWSQPKGREAITLPFLHTSLFHNHVELSEATLHERAQVRTMKATHHLMQAAKVMTRLYALPFSLRTSSERVVMGGTLWCRLDKWRQTFPDRELSLTWLVNCTVKTGFANWVTWHISHTLNQLHSSKFFIRIHLKEIEVFYQTYCTGKGVLKWTVFWLLQPVWVY